MILRSVQPGNDAGRIGGEFRDAVRLSPAAAFLPAKHMPRPPAVPGLSEFQRSLRQDRLDRLLLDLH